MRSILAIVNAPVIPTPGERRTRSLALWALSVFEPSLAVLKTESANAMQAVDRAMSEGGEGGTLVVDSLKVWHYALRMPHT